MIKLDLHSHSEASRDGGISPDQYADVLRDEILDMVAITDHNRIDFALGLQKALGEDHIIVGEEIETNAGEIIGLYLQELVKPHMSLKDTVDKIKAQAGLVYIPHPFETARKGLSKASLDTIADNVDIVEGCNGRALFQNFGPQATAWARQRRIPVAASSDAHGRKGLGHTHTNINHRPRRETLVSELGSARLVCKRPPLRTFLYPKINRLKNKVKRRG